MSDTFSKLIDPYRLGLEKICLDRKKSVHNCLNVKGQINVTKLSGRNSTKVNLWGQESIIHTHVEQKTWVQLFKWSFDFWLWTHFHFLFWNWVGQNKCENHPSFSCPCMKNKARRFFAQRRRTHFHFVSFHSQSGNLIQQNQGGGNLLAFHSRRECCTVKLYSNCLYRWTVSQRFFPV